MSSRPPSPHLSPLGFNTRRRTLVRIYNQGISGLHEARREALYGFSCFRVSSLHVELWEISFKNLNFQFLLRQRKIWHGYSFILQLARAKHLRVSLCAVLFACCWSLLWSITVNSWLLFFFVPPSTAEEYLSVPTSLSKVRRQRKARRPLDGFQHGLAFVGILSLSFVVKYETKAHSLCSLG